MRDGGNLTSVLTRLAPTVKTDEEPEIALHPAAVGVLLDALRDGAHKTQVITTSHSPDILEDNTWMWIQFSLLKRMMAIR